VKDQDISSGFCITRVNFVTSLNEWRIVFCELRKDCLKRDRGVGEEWDKLHRIWNQLLVERMTAFFEFDVTNFNETKQNYISYRQKWKNCVAGNGENPDILCIYRKHFLKKIHFNESSKPWKHQAAFNAGWVNTINRYRKRIFQILEIRHDSVHTCPHTNTHNWPVGLMEIFFLPLFIYLFICLFIYSQYSFRTDLPKSFPSLYPRIRMLCP
jgi:hypothetical protein